jgi:hypothetical protein
MAPRRRPPRPTKTKGTPPKQQEEIDMNTTGLIVLIALTPFIAMFVIPDTSGERVMYWEILLSIPVILGVIAQRIKGRTGAAWWFFTFVLMLVFYLITDVSMNHKAFTGLSGALLFGALPMAIIVATLPRKQPAPIR